MTREPTSPSCVLPHLLLARYIARATIGAYEWIINVIMYGPSRIAGGQRFEARAMIVTHEREKLIQAINYFARHTRKLGKTKLFKLLSFLDFEHFKLTGRSVTGLTYHAWPKGPVPVALQNELNAPGDDMLAILEIREIPVKNDNMMMTFKPKSDFDRRYFSRRELGLLEWLSSQYRDAASDEMIDATHLENLPWHKVYNEQGNRQAEIPYELAVKPDETDLVLNDARLGPV